MHYPAVVGGAIPGDVVAVGDFAGGDGSPRHTPAEQQGDPKEGVDEAGDDAHTHKSAGLAHARTVAGLVPIAVLAPRERGVHVSQMHRAAGAITP